jgi:hypothetical protein
VAALRAAAAERDARLRAARADVLEARAAVAERQGELEAAYAAMAETATERAALRRAPAQVRPPPPLSPS